jgi:hypothetical protein
MLGSREGFFRSGLTRACLNLSGKIQVSKDMLIIAVIVGSSGSRKFSVRNLVGMGSRAHVALAHFFIILDTSFCDAGSKQVKRTPSNALWSSVSNAELTIFSRPLRIKDIFETKNLLNLVANSCIDV